MNKLLRLNQRSLPILRRFASLITLSIIISFGAKAQTADFSFSVNNQCGNGTAIFEDLSAVAVTKWEWDFGNGNAPTIEAPVDGSTVSAIYPHPGTYTVSLAINDGPKTFKTIIIYPLPKPNFSPSVLSGCEPLDLILTASHKDVTVDPYMISGTSVGGVAGGNIVNYQWNFQGKIDGVIDTDPELPLSALGANDYGVLLIVTDEHGCEGTQFEPSVFQVFPTPSLDFTITKDNLCGIGNATFEESTSFTAGTISEYQWDIGNDGSIEATTESYTHDFTTSGTYDIALTLKTDQGCLSTKLIKQIQFNDANTSDFSYTGGCTGQNISFTDESSASAISWSWDFDNDNIEDSNLQNPTTSYSGPGDKTVNLTVTHDDGCIMTVSKTVSLSNATASFTHDQGSTCAPTYQVLFTSTSSASTGTITNYSWDFNNDGTEDSTDENPDFNFNTPGAHTVRLTVTSSEGCQSTKTEVIIINDKFLDFTTTTAAMGCENLSVGFQGVYSDIANDAVVSWNWTFEGSEETLNSNPTHTYPTRGEYDVTLRIVTTNGCVITKSKSNIVQIGTKPSITSVSTPPSSCAKDAISFTTNFTGLADSLVWNFSNGGNVSSSFVDGTSPQSISHNFTEASDTHSLTVKALDNGCASDPYNITNIQVYQPIANFTVSNNVICSIPSTVIFTNTSHSDDPLTTYEWDFNGDNIIDSTDKDPSFEYTTAGDFTVTLKVTNPTTSCTNETSQTIYVTTSTPDFSTNKLTACYPENINFTNQILANSSANFSIANVAWDFNNDGNIDSNSTNPSHNYTIPDLYSVKMTVTEQRGCEYSILKNDLLHINGPIASFTRTPTEVCINDVITFTNTSTSHADDPAIPAGNSYAWAFGDGNTSNLENPTNIYTSEDIFHVSLTVTDDNGCSNTITEDNSVIVPNLVAGFTSTKNIYCLEETVAFTNTAGITNGSASITNYEWDLDGDGVFEISTPSNANQSFLFTSTGTYTVKQRITSSLSCTNTFTKEITVIDGNGTFSLNDTNLGCAPASTTFNPNDPDNIITSYAWTFGDGETSDKRTPMHFYVNPGTYNVELTIQLTGGCTRTSNQDVFVAGPVGVFEYNNQDDCADPNHQVEFKASQMQDVTSLVWDYGNGMILNENIPAGTTEKINVYNYTTKGTKLPILILSDDGTCGSYSYIREDLGRINSSTPPTVEFCKSASSHICENVEFQFCETSVLTDDRYQIVKWSWDFNEDGIEDSNIKSPKFTYTTAGTFDVTLTVETAFGCTASLTKTDYITVVSPDNLKDLAITILEPILTNGKVCSTDALTFIGSATTTNGDLTISDWAWDFGDGNDATINNAIHTYDTTDEGSKKTVTLTVTDNSQCIQTITKEVSIYKVVADFSITSTPVLRGNNIAFADLSTSKIETIDEGNINGWSWTLSNGTPATSTIQNPSITYNTIGSNYDVDLTVTNSEGCTASTSKTVNVLNNPPVVNDFGVTGDEDTDITIPQSDFDTNYDTSLDPSQDPLIKVKFVSLPANGFLYKGPIKITATNTEFTYAELTSLKFIPNENWNGSTSFNYNAYDNYEYAVNDATITITVNQIQDIPIITNITDSQNKDVNTTFTSSLFENKFSDVDLVGNNNPDFQKIKITALPTGAMGILKLNGSNISLNQEILKADIANLVFEPSLGFVGQATFNWNASDGADYAASDASVSINYINALPNVSDRDLGNKVEDLLINIPKNYFTEKYTDTDVNDTPFEKIKITSLPSSGGFFSIGGSNLSVGQEITFLELDTDIIFTPANGHNGVISLGWDAFDGTEYTLSPATISFKYINTAPTVSNITKAAIDEDTQVNFLATDFSSEPNPFSDVDIYDDLAKIKIKSIPANGDIKLNGAIVSDEQVILLADLDNLQYHPHQDYNGTDSFTWKGNDGTVFSSNLGTVNLNINPIQDKPTVANINKSVVEDADVPILKADFIGKFTDVDAPYGNPNSTLTKITISTIPLVTEGILYHNGTPVSPGLTILVDDIDTGSGLIFDPLPGYEGSSTFNWNGSDGLDYADIGANVTIIHNNTIPTVTSHDYGFKLEDQIFTITRANIETYYNDADATDMQFEKIEIKDLPLTSIGKFTLDGNDLTLGEYTYAELVNGLVFTPLPGQNGIINLLWNAYDGTAYASDNANFSFTYINSVPIVDNFTKPAVDEDNNIVFTQTDFSSKYSDVDVNDSMENIKVTTLPLNGTLKYGTTTVTLNAEIDFADLTNLIFIPDPNWFGTNSFTWTGYDGTDYSTSTSTVSLEINSINDAPTAANESVSILEDSTHDFTESNFSNSYSDNYFGENSSFAGIKIVGIQTNGHLKIGASDIIINQTLNLTDIGNLVFSSDADENGIPYASFNFKVFDGEDYSIGTDTMTVNITPVNDVPSFTLKASPNVSVDEDSGNKIVNGEAITISKGPLNESSQTLTFQLTNDNSAIFSAQPTINAAGTLSFTPADNAFGTATVNVILKDDGGTANSGDDESNPQTFVITINAVNDHPVATDESITSLEDQIHTFSSFEFSNNYSDIELTPISGIRITAVESNGDLEYDGTDVSANLVIAVADIPKLKFTPAADANGNIYDSFRFEVYDGTDYSDVDYKMTINITPVNDEPSFILKTPKDIVLLEDSGTASIDHQVVTQLEGPLNESAQDLTLHVSHTNSGLFAINPVINAAGTLTFTPTPNVFGTSTVTVYITDNGGTANSGDDESDSQTFLITINSVNDAPTADNEIITILEDDAHNFSVLEFSNSYSDNYYGENSAFAGIKIVGLETKGYLKIGTSDIILNQVLTPTDIDNLIFSTDAHENGVSYASFEFKVFDGTDYSIDTYTMTVNITPVNDVPSFAFKASPNVNVNEDSGTTTVNGQAITISEGASNETSQTLTFELTNDNSALFSSQPTISPTGELSFTPATDAFGTATVTVILKDDGGTANSGDDESDLQTFVITVNSVNDVPIAVNDTNSVDEDNPVSGNVITNDTNLGDGPVTVTSNTNPTNGTVNVNSDGTYTYTPNDDFNGTDSFTYTITDGNLEESTATVTITVNSINDVPDAVDDINSVDEDNPISGNVLTNDINIGDGPATVKSNTNPTNGTVNVNSDGTYTYTPNDDFNGTDSFTYTIIDADGQESTATVTITVNSINDIPDAVDDINSVDEDNPVNGNVITNDTDLGDGPITVRLKTDPTNGTVNVNSDGTYTYTPNDDFNGTDSFTYTITDGNGDKDNATVTITVNSINDVPDAVDDTNSVDEDNPVSGNVITNDTDLGDGPVTVRLNTDPTNGTVNVNNDGTYTYTPNDDFNGTDSFTYTITDGNGDKDNATVTIIVNSINDVPVAVNDTNSVDEDNPVSGNVITNDTDLGDGPITVRLKTDSTNGTVNVNSDGTYTYTPNNDFNGTDSFTYTIEDNDGQESTATVTITVNSINDIPVAVNDINSVDEDNHVNGNVITNDTDLGDGPITVRLNTDPTNGTVNVNNDGTYTYTPNDDFNGTDSFTYTITDGNGDKDNATVTITVNSINDIPDAVDDTNSVDEDNPVSGNVITNDTDLGDGPITVRLKTDPTNGTVNVNSDGTYTYTPNDDFNGTDSFTYTIEDHDGQESTATVTITVNSINDIPVAVNDTNSIDEDNPVSGNVITNDTDLGDGPITVRLNTDPTNGTVIVNNDGTYTYIPNDDFNGTDSFTYTIIDSDGQESTATVTITVNSINDIPDAVDDINSVDEDNPVSGNVLTNDTDLGDGPVTVTSNTNPTNGTVTVNNDGTYTYTPNDDFNGIDSFTYTITDDDGQESTATVTITVNSINDIPVAVNDTNSVDEDNPVSGNVITNDTDLGDGPVTVTSNTNPTNGTVNVNSDGTYTYTPNDNFNGTDSFTYTITDDDGQESTATVTISVNSINDIPLAVDDDLWLKEDSSISGNVFNNDEKLFDTPVVILSHTDPTNGTLVINSDGTFTYTPNSGYFGNDSFSYTLRDIDGDESTAIVNIIIDPLDYEPIANDDFYIINEDEISSGNLFLNDKDFINPPVIIISNTDTTNGTLVVNSDGTYTYTPNKDFFGIDTFTYTIEDADGDQDTATVSITVKSINDIPVAIDDINSTKEDTAVNGNVLTNDTDLGDKPVIILSNTNPSNGVVVINSNGMYTYTPNDNFNGVDTFTYTIEDEDGEQSTASVTIIVDAVNDAPIADDEQINAQDNLEINIDVLDGDIEPDGDIMTVSIITNPLYGNAILNNDGSITYTADLGSYCKTDEITYQICDPEGLCDQATVTIQIGVLDSDDDSIPDAIETLTAETDSDSILDYLDLDSDNDGISDRDEAQISDPCNDLPVDTDGDGIPDYKDSDSDNDGYPDKDEGDDDCDNDGIPNYIDSYDDCSEYITVPEAFSPNGDGVNDFFVIKGIKDFPNSIIMIFNRWGAKIYSKKGYQNDWDGRSDNRLTVGSDIIPEGTYYYVIELKNGSRALKGFIFINY